MRLFFLLAALVLAVVSPSAVVADSVFVYEQQASAMPASSYVFGRNTRILNYQIGDESWFSLDSVGNTFTLAAGTYSISVVGEIDGGAEDHRMYLTDVTVPGTPVDIFAGPPRTPYIPAVLDTLVTLTDSTTYSLIHSVRSESGYFGEQATYMDVFTAPVNEIYLTLKVSQVA
jgi:hypothetical protein